MPGGDVDVTFALRRDDGNGVEGMEQSNQSSRRMLHTASRVEISKETH